MKNSLAILILIFLSQAIYPQCKNILLGNSVVDSVLMDEYSKISSDTFLVVNFANSYILNDKWGIIATINNGDLNIIKYFTKRGKLKKKKIISRKEKKHIMSFFSNSLWNNQNKLFIDNSIVVFHPSSLKIHYYDPETNWCRYFTRINGLTQQSLEDPRVIWINRLIKIL